jgi:hypothetical protein
MMDKVEFEKKCFWMMLMIMTKRKESVLILQNLHMKILLISSIRELLFKKKKSTKSKESSVIKSLDKEAQQNKVLLK